MLEIQNHYKDITPAAVDRMYEALHADRAEHERSISLAERAADALEPARHYKVADARLCNRIETQCPGVKARVRYDSLYSYRGNTETANWQVWARNPYACVQVQLPRGHSVGDLIDALRACPNARASLARANGQIEGIEEMIEAEEHLRALVKEIEMTRERIAQQVLGASHVYFNDAVRDVLPALGGKR